MKSENFATQYFHTLDSIKERINKRGSWSTYITIVSEGASKILYSTPEFKKFKKQLIENPPSKEFIKKYLQRKDEFELSGYFENIEGFDLTKALMSHIRRKLQIMNYFQNKKIIFDYDKCLKDISLTPDKKEKLRNLYQSYENREELDEKEVGDYYGVARELTEKILRE